MRVCTVQNCDRPLKARGMCGMHYARLSKYGCLDAPGPPRPKRGTVTKFFEDSIAYKGKECLIWPFTKDSQGYGWFQHGDRRGRVSRLMCIATHGEPPFPEAEAAHACGNKLCFSPNCLRWATHLENEQDKIAHGTRVMGEMHGSAKLTKDQVLAIAKDVRSGPAVAADYGITHGQVWHIRTGKSWSHVTGIQRKAA